MRYILSLIFLITTSVAVWAQLILPPIAPEVALYASSAYTPLADLSNVSINIFDARTTDSEDIMPLFDRYIDGLQKVHPSVLSNKRLPSHFVIVASTPTDVANALQGISPYTANIQRKTGVKVVLLYGGDAVELSSMPLPCVIAVFAMQTKCANPFDLLTQALFCGIDIANHTEWLSLDGGRLLSVSQAKTRLSYGAPESVAMSTELLTSIDTIATQMIDDEASPGCYVMVVRQGVVVWNKGYGQTRYKNGQAITPYHIYDLASVSKVIGTLPIVMKLFDNKKINEKMELGTFFPNLDADKQRISIEELLLHRSGLPAGIPHYLLCVDSTSFEPPLYSRKRKTNYTTQIEANLYINSKAKLKATAFSDKKSEQYPVQVSDHLYASDSMRTAVLSYIDNVSLLKKTYRYSDLNFIYLQEIAEKTTGKSLNDLFDAYVARPLGIKRLLYRPLTKYNVSQIVPTEDDKYFRQAQVCGTVHDQTAALLGGVAGNAGLFGTANEVAKIAQMYLNKGTYGGVRLLKADMVTKFTRRNHASSRRGYGFDKPERSGGGPVTEMASGESYGHSGFSGTYVWIDPQYDLIYIFLSNRIHPNAYNNKLTQNSVRSKVHEAIYNAITDQISVGEDSEF